MAVLDWQPSFFGADEPRPDSSFSSLTRRELERGAWLDHQPGWLHGHDALFAELVERNDWHQRTRHMYESVVDEPRLTAWGGDVARIPVLDEIRTRLSTRYGVTFDSVGCNLYRDGRDGVAWHGDTVRKTMATPLVAIVSLGQPRKLLLRPRGGGASIRYELGTGDLFVMGGTCQHTWEHCVPKVAHAGARMSVTYRHSRP